MSPPVDEPSGWDDYDTPAEVDAVFRTQRRIAVGHFVVFLCGVLLLPALTLAVDWWSGGRVADWWTSGFALAGVGMYVFFFLLGLAAASLANGVERRMLGAPRDASTPSDEA